MKYVFTFLFTLLGCFIFYSFPVSAAYSYTVTVDETAINETADTLMNQYLSSDYSPYYVYYKFQFPALGNNNGAFGYQKIYFQDAVTFNIPTNDAIRLSSSSPRTSTIYANVINLRAGGYRIDGYSNTWINSTNAILSYDSLCNITIIANTVPVTFNGNTYDPPPDVQGDTFFVTKDGFTNNFGVFCGPASEYVDNGEQLPLNYYRTKVYTVHIKFQYQGSTVDYIVPNYLNWLYKYNTYVKSEDVSNVLEYLPAYTYYAEPIYKTSMQAIRCPVINEPVVGGNVVGYDFDNMIDYRSFNQITLSQILSALSPTYSTLTINDLYTSLIFEFYDSDGRKAFSAVNDYSSLYNSGVEPTDDPYVTNLTQQTENLNQYLTSNNKYLQDIIYGDVYEPMPYEKSIKDAGSVNLDLISVPEYSYEKHIIDTSATSFFGRMVEWWYLDTPFGIIATVALTFLVIRVILW